MKPLVRVAVIALSLSLPLTIASTGCGKELCEEAYDKGMECVDNMKCKGSDPLDLQRCEAAKNQAQQINETAFKLACDEVEAQKYIDCALDPVTCTCPF